MYVKVPGSLAESLAEDGFREGGFDRGVEVYVNGAELLLATASNMVTVFVGRHEISRFIAHLWASARRRNADASPHGISVVIQSGGQRVAITLEHEGFGDGTPPQEVVQGMAALLKALASSGGELPPAQPD